MKNYYRIMLGRKSKYAEEGFKGNFIGADFDIHEDLKNNLPDRWQDFNKKYIPVFLQANPDKPKVAAGLACGLLWTVCKGINIGDIVISPDGKGSYKVGEIASDYSYHPNEILPHRRSVKWYPDSINRADMSTALQNSTGAIGTVCSITKYAVELETLIGGNRPPQIISTDETVEDPSEFALEEHLEEFLVKNWKYTEFGKGYNVFEEDGEPIGKQYPTDTGKIDILAISKDKKELLVIELKKGRASDNVVGQIQRYMGYVQEVLAEKEQTVKGVIIALEDDLRIKRALSVAKDIEFYRYQVSFKLYKNSVK